MRWDLFWVPIKNTIVKFSLSPFLFFFQSFPLFRFPSLPVLPFSAIHHPSSTLVLCLLWVIRHPVHTHTHTHTWPCRSGWHDPRDQRRRRAGGPKTPAVVQVRLHEHERQPGHRATRGDQTMEVLQPPPRLVLLPGVATWPGWWGFHVSGEPRERGEGGWGGLVVEGMGKCGAWCGGSVGSCSY